MSSSSASRGEALILLRAFLNGRAIVISTVVFSQCISIASLHDAAFPSLEDP